MNLAEFLLARIAEDETVARAAMLGPWRVRGDDRDAVIVDRHDQSVLDVGGEFCSDLWLNAYDTDLAHIARHDPARVLAECAAKRAIAEWFSNSDPDDQPVAKMLAQPYVDHPDFRAEWGAS